MGGERTGFALPICQVLVTRRNVKNDYSPAAGVCEFLMHADMIVNRVHSVPVFRENENHSHFWGSTNVLLK